MYNIPPLKRFDIASTLFILTKFGFCLHTSLLATLYFSFSRNNASYDLCNCRDLANSAIVYAYLWLPSAPCKMFDRIGPTAFTSHALFICGCKILTRKEHSNTVRGWFINIIYCTIIECTNSRNASI